MEECRPIRPVLGVERELRTVAVNAVIGGATAAVIQLFRDGSAWDAFWTGALGGGVAYAGKRLAVEDFAGAGFLGRGVNSLGSSVIRNAGEGRGAFHEMAVPVGPVRVYFDRVDGVHARLDVATVLAAAALVVGYDARLDPGASLSAGALVFRGAGPMPGLSAAGAMMVWEDMPASEGPRLMAHERVHLLQYDQAVLTWSGSAEEWIAGRSLLGRSLTRYMDFGGVALGAHAALSLLLEYRERPWESEAYFLAELAHPVH